MPSSSTHRDASNGGIDTSGKCNFDRFLIKHRFRFFIFLLKNHIFIEKLLFSWDTERMDITVDSVASKRFGWTNSQPIRMLYHDFLSKSVFLQGWSGSTSKQASLCFIYVCVCICIFIYIYIYMYVCMYVCVCVECYFLMGIRNQRCPECYLLIGIWH